MLGRWASTTAAAKKVYGLRYKLLTYMYGSMYLAHKKGGTLARPIFFSDPSDLKARYELLRTPQHPSTVLG